MVVFMGLQGKKYHRSVRNVATVCVAAIALGASTYAWFVSNNIVKATTTNISAQNNSAYLVIDNAATTADYTLANTFYIGTGTYDGIFKDLKVTSVTVNNTTDSQLTDAMRVLVTCGDAWAVWSNKGLQASSDASGSEVKGNGILKADEFGQGITGTTKDATVKVYVYYDGADTNVYTTNLENLKDCGVTITFEATPTEYGK